MHVYMYYYFLSPCDESLHYEAILPLQELNNGFILLLYIFINNICYCIFIIVFAHINFLIHQIIEETGEEESNYNKNIEENTAIEEENDLNNNNGTPVEKTSDKVNQKETQENNIAATSNKNEDYAMDDIIEDLSAGIINFNI